MIQRAYKVELAPTELQARELARHVGVCRWVYNWTLTAKQERYRAGGRAGKELNRELTGRIDHLECPQWVGAVSAVARREAQVDVDNAYKNAFRRLKEGKRGRAVGWPRHRNRRHERYWYSVSGGGRCELILGRHDHIGMVGITGPVRVKERNYLPTNPGKIISCSYSRVAGRHYLSVACEVEDPGNRGTHARGPVGIDVGSKTAMTLSDGRRVEAPLPLTKYAAKLKRAQRSVSRKYEARKIRNGTVGTKAKGPMGSSERRARDRVSRLNAEIARIRLDWQHKTTIRLAKRYGIIRVEDLSLSGMTRSGKGSVDAPGKMVRQRAGRNRKLLDIGLGEISRQLAYKGQWYGCGFEKVDRFFPSTQLCSACGAQTGPHGVGQLGVRWWACPECGTVHDRDENAAVNIRDYPDWSKASDGRWSRGPASETLGLPRTEQPCWETSKAEHTVDLGLAVQDASPLAAAGDPVSQPGEALQVGAVDDRRARPVDQRRPATRKGGISTGIDLRERLGDVVSPVPARIMTEPEEAATAIEYTGIPGLDDDHLDRRSRSGPQMREIIGMQVGCHDHDRDRWRSSENHSSRGATRSPLS